MEAWGCVESPDVRPDGHRPCASCAVRRPEDWRRIGVLDPTTAPGYSLHVETIVRMGFDRRIGDAPALPTVFSPLSLARKLSGDRLREDLRAHPDLVRGALEAITETLIKFADVALTEGVSGIFYSIQAASLRQHTEEEYAEFGEPYDRRFLESLGSRSALTVIHCHGDRLMFDRLARLRGHVWNWDDRGSGPSLKEGRAAVRGALVGGLDQWKTLRDGTPESAVAETEDALAQTGGRGLIIAARCCAPDGNPRPQRRRRRPPPRRPPQARPRRRLSSSVFDRGLRLRDRSARGRVTFHAEAQSSPPMMGRLDSSDVDGTIQRVRLELYRENIQGALALLEAAAAAHPDPRYETEGEGIRRRLEHLQSREAYQAAQEAQYHRLRGRLSLRYLEKLCRVLIGRKTRKLIARRADKDEFRLLEREIAARRPARVLDGGAGEGGVALAVAARHPEIEVEAVEASATNVRMARRLNRFANVRIQEGLLEEVHLRFPPASFDLVYSFAVLEHVRDVEATVRSIFTVLRPGGRFCFVVPRLDFVANGPLPPYEPPHGYCDHVRAFTETELRERFGGGPDFMLEKTAAVEKPHKVPAFLVPVELGAFFVAMTVEADGPGPGLPVRS